MYPNVKFAISSLLLSTLFIASGYCQQLETGKDTLILTDQDRRIENSVSFTTTNLNYKKTTISQKVNLKPLKVIINGDTLVPEKVRTRGQSTLFFRRKSYSIGLESHVPFFHGERSESLKRFYLIGLTMDKYYTRNRLAFGMMEATHLFNLFYSFCELKINGEEEGICMVIERPEDWALKKKDSPVIIRRGYDNNIRRIKTGRKTTDTRLHNYRGDFRQIYRALNKHQGEDLYNTLSKWLEMDVYMKWLAFNFFVRNGDYSDEAFFYLDPATNKFSIIPWDYDDLFSLEPHEGNSDSKRFLADKFIFSIEDELDKKIVTDEFLYKKYKIQFEELMNELTADVIRRVFENTYTELYPYYSNDEIISKSGYDLYKDANLSRMKNDMSALYEQLIFNRSHYLKSLRPE